jgi:hypothetical protein
LTTSLFYFDTLTSFFHKPSVIMRNFTSIFYALTILESANSLQLEKRDNPAVVSIPFQKVAKSTLISNSSESKHAPGPIEVLDLKYMPENSEFAYVIRLDIGTPLQPILAILDTGSPSLVIHTTNDSLCEQPAIPTYSTPVAPRPRLYYLPGLQLVHQ